MLHSNHGTPSSKKDERTASAGVSMADVCWVGEASHRGAHRDSKSVIRGTRQKEITRNQLFRNTHTPHTHIFLNGYTTIRKAKETIKE